MRQFRCNAATDFQWNPNKRCFCSVRCDNVQREGRCADEVCCDTLDWYKRDTNLPNAGFVLGGANAPCFPFCTLGWHPGDPSRRCCENCNAPSAGSSSGGTTKKTSGGGSNQNNPTSKENMATRCNGAALLLIVPFVFMYSFF